MLSPEQVAELTDYLLNLSAQDTKTIDSRTLAMLGALVVLEQDATQPSVSALEIAAGNSPVPLVRDSALNVLVRLSNKENPDAIRSLFRLALDFDSNESSRAIQAHTLSSPDERQNFLFSFLFQVDRESSIDLAYLTQIYLTEEQPALKARLLKRAQELGYDNWIWLVLAIEDRTETGYQELVQRYAAFNEAERNLALTQLKGLAKEKVFAQEAIAEICIQYDDAQACDLTKRAGYAPRDPIRQAMYYFLTQQWDDYGRVDFNHQLLSSAYEIAGPALRQRILSHSRMTGQVAWLNSAQRRKLRFLTDLSDAEWNSIIQQLQQQGRQDALFAIAQSAPPVVSAAIFHSLNGMNAFDAEIQNLIDAAVEAISQPIEVRPKKTLHSGSPILSLAASPDGRHLAAGSQDPAVQLWDFPHWQWKPSLSGPVAQTRTLAFSPDSESIIVAGGDHVLRVFRLADRQLIKSLAGHTALVRSVAIHPDGRTVFSTGFDGTLRAWRFPQGPEITQIKPGGELFGLALGEDGKYVITGGTTGALIIWKWPEAVEVRRLETNSDGITGLASTPKGQLVAASTRQGQITVWNHTSGRELQSFHAGISPVTALFMAAEQQFLFSGEFDGTAKIWSIATGEMIGQFQHTPEPITGITSLHGENLLATSAGREITLWDLDLFANMRTPVLDSSPEMIRHAEVKLAAETHQAARSWRKFQLTLLRWKARFDIQLHEPHQLEVGEFDIQL